MIYVTQLVYIHDGAESIFNEFESIAIPIIKRYDGELLLRIRPTGESIVEANAEVPYEIHIVNFPSAEHFEKFMADDERKKFLHLKEKAIKTTLIIKGNRL